MTPKQKDQERSAGQPSVWHELSAAAVAQRLESDLDSGLSSNEAARRLARDGPNDIREQGRRSIQNMIVSQFKDFMILVLIAAALVSGIVGDAEETIAILAIVLLTAAIGIFQDFRAERAIAALKRLAASKAEIVRAGHRQTIAASEIVSGDIVLLEAGTAVPADLRLIEAPRLKIIEATLTGESVPVEKRTVALANTALPLAERTNMAFKGTIVTYGRARGIAVATGMATELGKIAGMLEAVPRTQTPLQKRLAVFGRQVAVAVLVICAIVFTCGLLRGEPALLMLLSALSLAVAAIDLQVSQLLADLTVVRPMAALCLLCLQECLQGIA